MHVQFTVQIFFKITLYQIPLIADIGEIFFILLIFIHPHRHQKLAVNSLSSHNSAVFIDIDPLFFLKILRLCISHDILRKIPHKVAGRPGIFIEHFIAPVFRKILFTSVIHIKNAAVHTIFQHFDQVSAVLVDRPVNLLFLILPLYVFRQF